MPKERSLRTNRFSTMATDQGIPSRGIGGNESNNIGNPELANIQLPNLNMPPPVANIRATPELVELIRGIVIDSYRNTNTDDELRDEVINDRSNLDGLDKIPDIVRCIREFSGDPMEYTSWRKNVDRVLEVYADCRGTPKYFGIVSVIRGKIIGEANIALESYNTPLNWLAIKKCLNTHYADKRDISTLEYQLSTLVQGSMSIDQFYQRVYRHFSLILNNIMNMNLDRSTEMTFIDSYRNRTLDTFIRGLNGDLPRLLAIREPKSLPEALHICTKLANQNYRANYANSKQFPPPLPPKQNYNENIRQNNNNYGRTERFYPQLTHYGPTVRNQNNIQQQQGGRYMFPNYEQRVYQYARNNQQVGSQNQFVQNQPHQNQAHQNQFNQNFVNRNNYVPPRPNVPKPQPPAEPMEIDRSIRSQLVNYANRPKQQPGLLGKRQTNTNYPVNYPQKQTRNFHIDNEPQTDNTELLYNFDDIQNSLNDVENEPFNEYMQQYEQEDKSYDDNIIDTTDIHFLG